MKTRISLALAIAAIVSLSGCVVGPARGNYQDRDHSYDHRYHGHGHYDDRNTGQGGPEDRDH
jgi:hypothetical protein